MSTTLRSRKSGCSGCFFFLVFIPITLFSLIILLGIGLGVYLRKDYISWQNDFEGKISKSEYIYYDGVTVYDDADGTKIRLSADMQSELEKKLADFNSTTGEKTRTLELNVDQSHLLLGQSVQKGMPDTLSLYRTYLDTDDGKWLFYIQFKVRAVQMPWIILGLQKGEYESPIFSVESVRIGNYDLDDIGLYFVREQINGSIKSAYDITAQNEWSSIVIENIELTKEGTAVKGVNKF